MEMFSTLLGLHEGELPVSIALSLQWELLYLASVHGFMHETSDFFYSIITFSYTKYFEHSYTADVVFTLSYLKEGLIVEADCSSELMCLYLMSYMEELVATSSSQ